MILKILMFILLLIHQIYGSCCAQQLFLNIPNFYTSGSILKNNNQTIHLHCVNLNGFESLDYVVAGLHKISISQMVDLIKNDNFNCVRLLWSTEMVVKNPIIRKEAVKANPQFIGESSLSVFDILIQEVTYNNIYIVLDNHMHNNEWCCSGSDQNGLWYNDDYSETTWINAWEFMAQRYYNNSMVIGADLRNEIRTTHINNKKIIPTWGSGNPTNDWKLASQKVGNIIHNKASHWLIFISCLEYGGNCNFLKKPNNALVLDKPNKVIYVAHNYEFWYNTQPNDFQQDLENRFGFISTNNIAPVWLNEFGIPHYSKDLNRWYWKGLINYLEQHQSIHWAYWTWTGTQTTGNTRIFNSQEHYGYIDTTYTKPASVQLQTDLDSIKFEN